MKLRNFFIVFVTAFLGGFIGVYFYEVYFQEKDSENKIVTKKEFVPARLANYSSRIPSNVNDFTEAANKSVEAVVHVNIKADINQNNTRDYSYGNPFYDFFFGPQYPQRNNRRNRSMVIGSGSGVIISNDGYIITNNHVIEHAGEIEVVLNDRRSFVAKLIGTDPTTDIALLKIEANDLHYLTFGDSDNLKIGEWVLAVGNPFNLTSTVTAGIVSAKSRNINVLANRNKPMGIESFIQTDAAVNPGNSGGALVNTHGELVGINTAIASQTGSYAGYSFAVPVSIAKKVILDIKEFGVVQRAFLGVQIRGVDADLAKQLNLDNVEGVYVDKVVEEGGANKAGINEKDIIISIDNVKVNTNSQLIEQVTKHRPGDKVLIKVKRDGRVKHFEVVLRNNYGSTELVNNTEGNSTILGAKLKKLTVQEKSKFGIDYGMKIVALGKGKLKESGLQKDFIMLKANNQPISNISDLQEAVAKSDGGLLIKGVFPNGQIAYYAINLEQ